MNDYVADPFVVARRATREVRVGDVGVGGENPIRVQSMTTTPTLDTVATADQAERMVAAGCEIVRITAPSIRDAENLAAIRKELDARGVRVPLVADIHYTPNAAMEAALHVEKVRVNPGNYADKKKFEVREYTDSEYAAELERVAERFVPLVRRCKELGRAMRIGTNHGSLSDRIMNRFGDTPAGMVASALEFLDVCEAEGFHEVVFSMKASNPQVAIQAYRLLAAELAGRSEGAPDYPFHVGVTEAGDGEDGRIKSAIGIGSLLEDGIGDTIRVSLTEDPVKEIPVARALAARYDARWASASGGASPLEAGTRHVDDPYAHLRRATQPVRSGAIELGGGADVVAELELGPAPPDAEAATEQLLAGLASQPNLACEGVLVDARDSDALERARAFEEVLGRRAPDIPLVVRFETLDDGDAIPGARWVVEVGDGDATRLARIRRRAGDAGVALEWSLVGGPADVVAQIDRLLASEDGNAPAGFAVSVESELPVHSTRAAVAHLKACGRSRVPVVLRRRFDPLRDLHGDEAALLAAATDVGALLCDGIGDAVAIGGFGGPGRSLALIYRILQGARLRTTWTEYISCPSCGRTLFDLEEVTERIKARTEHLSGVKIAVMGCIVNGPGEMADADFGYVGSGPARVNLYVGKELVERNLPEDEAPDRLVDLIKKHGRWSEPS